MRKQLCGASSGIGTINDSIKPKKRRTASTYLLSESKFDYEKIKTEEDKFALLSEDYIVSEAVCVTEGHENSRIKSSHTRTRSMQLKNKINHYKPVVMRFLLESLLGDQTVMFE